MGTSLHASSLIQTKPPDLFPDVLVVHNRYQRFGGEDSVVDAETELLRAHGAAVHQLIADSGDQEQMRALKLRPDRLISNGSSYRETRAIIQRHRPEVVHCHNLMPLLGPAVYAAAADERVAVVQTVHNRRFACLNGINLRDGAACQLCRPGHYLPGIRHGCYRDSHAQSAILGIAQTIHHWTGAWQRPDLFIVTSEFMRHLVVSWGWPDDRVVVIPHFVQAAPERPAATRSHALFVGRLSPEKGLDLLLDAWSDQRPPLIIAGDGPLRDHLARRIADERRSNVTMVGSQSKESVSSLLGTARFLVAPSISNETFGLVIIEAFAHGTPVVASRIGAYEELIEHRRTGLLFDPSDRDGLRIQLDELERDAAGTARLAEAARQVFDARYTADAHLAQLRNVYAAATMRRATDHRGQEWSR